MSRAQQYLEMVRVTQKLFWAAVAVLECELDIEIDPGHDFDNWEIEDLIKEASK